jgi:RNA polymerase sigma-70 factor (ECF subfamily)
MSAVRRAPVEPEPIGAAGRVWDFDAFFREHAPRVARWALRLGGPLVDAEDVVQEVFVVAERKAHQLRPGVRASTWLFGITTRIVKAQRRRERLRRWLAGSASEFAAELAAPDPSALEQLARRQALATVHRLASRLPERQRTAFLLHELDGLSALEIAELMRSNATTVRVWLHRARARFLAELAAHDAREEGRA